jgi:Cu(I)/Ag(I) efflux system membrane fusion protein/cobalt-zinc-cadmium efflux system membrane fusion protein
MTRRLAVTGIAGALIAAAAVTLSVRPTTRATLIGWITGERSAGPAAGEHDHAAGSSTPATATTPRGEVVLDTRRQQLIGVRTAEVTRVSLTPTIRTVGTVTFDETRQSEISLKVDGWIRDLYADYTGRLVARGEPLFTLYSPDLLATQNELLLAHRGHERTAEARTPGVREYSERLIESARQRLLLFDVSREEIADLERAGTADGVVTFRSPVSGTIVEKTAVRGMRVMAGQSLFKLADLSVVWVEATVYEQDLPVVRVGQRATVTVDAYAGQRFVGNAIYIHSIVDERSRAGRVRFRFQNPGGRLKPGMYANVELDARAISALAVPGNAVLDSGVEQIVFVAGGEGRFTPRPVRTGRRVGDVVEIVEGLAEGERVATSAAFFLDSESQLRAGLQSYEATPPPGAGGEAAVPARLDIAFTSRPDPPRVGDSTFEVAVKDAAGTAVDAAEVSVVLFMPAMPTMNMPAMRSETKLTPAGQGIYRGTGQVLMGGRWDVTVNVSQAGATLGSRQFALVAR